MFIEFCADIYSRGLDCLEEHFCGFQGVSAPQRKKKPDGLGNGRTNLLHLAGRGPPGVAGTYTLELQIVLSPL